MEESNSFNFPEDAITFLNDIMKSVEVDFTIDYFEKISNENYNALEVFKMTIQALNDIKIIKKYNVPVTLKNYLEVFIFVVILLCLHLFLFKGSYELIKTLIRNNAINDDIFNVFLHKYILRWNLDLDQLFYDQIKVSVKKCVEGDANVYW